MSFPSFSSFPDLDPGSSKSTFQDKNKERNSKHDKDKDRKREKDRDKDKDRHGSKRRHRSRSRSRDGSKRTSKAEDRNRRDKAGKLTEKTPLFYSDKRGDKLNVEYGGLHSGDVPKYHLVARGKEILGLPTAWVASYRGRYGVEIGVKVRRKMSELTDSKTRALLETPPTRRLLQQNNIAPVDDTADFLNLSSRPKKSENQHLQRSIEMIPEDDGNSAYSSDLSEGGEDDAGSGSESDEIQLTAYQLQLKELNHRVEQEPSSSTAWILLLRHMLSTVPLTSKNAAVARAEMTLSVMSRALEADTSNPTSKILKLTYMKAGEVVWDKSKIEVEWEEALKIGGAEIWMEWLEWRIRKSEDGIGGVVQDAVRVLSTLGRSDQDEMLKVRVLWRIALVYKNAGLVELSTALFQAEAELTFGLPWSLYNASHRERIHKLEEFWESETPRIGEEGAEGWSAWVDEGMQQPNQPPQKQPLPEEDFSDLDPYRLWWKRESHGDRVHLVPSRSYSENDDPYGTILFSDIQPLLVSFDTEAARHAFRFAWLSVLGLHIPGLSTFVSPEDEMNWDDRWNLSPLTDSAHLGHFFPSGSTLVQLSTDAAAGTIIGREKTYSSGFGPVRNWSYGVLTPLDDPSIDSFRRKANSRCGIWTSLDIQEVDHAFVRRVFSQLQTGETDDEWDQYSLAFEIAISPKSAIKQSRYLLKRTESLSRWIAHAQLEILRGHSEDARKVFEAVAKTLPNVMSNTSVGRFWWTWAEMEWLDKNGQRSLDIILQSVQLQGDGRIMMLRARRSLDERIQAACGWKDREYWIRLRLLVEFLSTQDPSIAISVMDTYLGQISERRIPHESLTVAALSMLYHYSVSLKNPMPPVILRERAQKALERYPSNSIILGIFLEGERGQSVWGRIKTLFGEREGVPKDVSRCLAEVWMAGWEHRQWYHELERTRTGLAGAVDNERTRGSHVLWRVYLEFEIRSGDLGRAKKGINL